MYYNTIICILDIYVYVSMWPYSSSVDIRLSNRKITITFSIQKNAKISKPILCRIPGKRNLLLPEIKHDKNWQNKHTKQNMFTIIVQFNSVADTIWRTRTGLMGNAWLN